MNVLTTLRLRRSAIRPAQHAVITGGPSGLGLELGRQLAARGLRLTLVARDPAKLESAAAIVSAEARAAGVDVVAVDVSDPAPLHTAFTTIAAANGGIDLLINSAGILREGYFETPTESDFRDVMAINFFGALNTIRAALPYLKASRGSIVNIASVAGLTGVFGYTPYCAAKHALVGFTESLRFELEPQGVRIQLACPAEFDSPMVAALDLTRTPENREHALTIPKISIGQVAAEIVSGIDAGQRTILPGTRTRLLVNGQRLAPAIANAIARQRIKAVYQGPRPDAVDFIG